MDNMLNSVLIEGQVTEVPNQIIKDGLPYCSFGLKSYRVETDNANHQKRTQTTLIVISTGRLAEMCLKFFKSGTAVRIVGRLVNDTNDSLAVIAEHVELKPVKKANEVAK